MNGLLSLLLPRRKPTAQNAEGYWPLDLPLIRFSERPEDTWTLRRGALIFLITNRLLNLGDSIILTTWSIC